LQAVKLDAPADFNSHFLGLVADKQPIRVFVSLGICSGSCRGASVVAGRVRRGMEGLALSGHPVGIILSRWVLSRCCSVMGLGARYIKGCALGWGAFVKGVILSWTFNKQGAEQLMIKIIFIFSLTVIFWRHKVELSCVIALITLAFQCIPQGPDLPVLILHLMVHI
jgi:hypothetical protein